MQSYTRRELKQDKFAETAQGTYNWALGHSKAVVATVIATVAVVLIAAAGWYYSNQRGQQASEQLGKALRTYSTPLRPAGAPPQPDVPSFTSVAERGAAAHKQFADLAASYPHTPAGKAARYFAGVASIDAGNNAEAESTLKDAASDSGPEVSALAKFALAALYRSSGRVDDAIHLYKEIVDKPTLSVPKITAQLELASAFETKQPGEAIKIYEQIQTEGKVAKEKADAQAKLNKNSANNASETDVIPSTAIELATARLAVLKGGPPTTAIPTGTSANF